MATAADHGEALGVFCEYAVTLQQRLPDVICTRTAKTYIGNSLRQTVTAEVRHSDGRDTYRYIVRNGLPFSGSMSELPGSWSEGEFGSILGFLFAEGSHTQFRFERLTKWKSTPALLFQFQVARENNRAWYLEVNHQKAYPGLKGKFWLDASSDQLLRLEMEAEQLPQAVAAGRQEEEKNASGHDGKHEERPPFQLVGDKKWIDYASVHLADGSDFVLPTTSEEQKCLRWGRCFTDRLSFENCHKFGAKSRIVTEVP